MSLLWFCFLKYKSTKHEKKIHNISFNVAFMKFKGKISKINSIHFICSDDQRRNLSNFLAVSTQGIDTCWYGSNGRGRLAHAHSSGGEKDGPRLRVKSHWRFHRKFPRKDTRLLNQLNIRATSHSDAKAEKIILQSFTPFTFQVNRIITFKSFEYIGVDCIDFFFILFIIF